MSLCNLQTITRDSTFLFTLTRLSLPSAEFSLVGRSTDDILHSQRGNLPLFSTFSQHISLGLLYPVQ